MAEAVEPFDPEEFQEAIADETGQTEQFAENHAAFKKSIEDAAKAADENPESVEFDINEALVKGDPSGLKGAEREIFEKKLAENKKVADSLNKIAKKLNQSGVNFDATEPLQKNFDESVTGKANTEFMQKLVDTYEKNSTKLEENMKADRDSPETSAAKRSRLDVALKLLAMLPGLATAGLAVWFGAKILNKMASDASTCSTTSTTDIMNVKLDCPDDLKENSDGTLKKDFINACNCPAGGGFPNEITKFCPSADKSRTCPDWEYNFNQVSPWDVLGHMVTTFVDAGAESAEFLEKLVGYLKKYWWIAVIILLLALLGPPLIRLLSSGTGQ